MEIFVLKAEVMQAIDNLQYFQMVANTEANLMVA